MTDYPKTKTELEKDGFFDDDLFVAIMDNLDDEDPIGDLIQIAQYGIGGGFGKFIYYHDTVSFFHSYEDEIMEKANEEAENFGENSIFAVAVKSADPPFTLNAMVNYIVWFTVETFAHMVYDIAYDQGEINE